MARYTITGANLPASEHKGAPTKTAAVNRALKLAHDNPSQIYIVWLGTRFVFSTQYASQAQKDRAAQSEQSEMETES